MLPELFISISDLTPEQIRQYQQAGKLGPMTFNNAKKYFKDQYPDSDDCILLDKQILAIQIDIDEILKRDLADQKEANGSLVIKIPCKLGTSGCSNLTFSKTALNVAFTAGILVRKYSLSLLQELMREKKNKSITLDCRNKIETLRQDETAGVFTETSTQAEKTVIGDSKNKQYLLVGVASVVLITVAVIFFKYKK